jgi:hypothetical protein
MVRPTHCCGWGREGGLFNHLPNPVPLLQPSHTRTTHAHSVQKQGSGPLALLVSLFFGLCLLPFLLALVPLLLLWPLTLLVLSVRVCARAYAPSSRCVLVRLTRTPWGGCIHSTITHLLTSKPSPPPNAIATNQTTTVLVVGLTPLGALWLWLVFASQPVQGKLMRPLLHAALQATVLRRLLTLRRAPGW